MKTTSHFVKTLVLVATFIFFNILQAEVKIGVPTPSDKDVITTFGLSSQASLAKRINILVWNLHKGENDDFPADFVSLVQQKDIVLMEEIYLSPVMRIIFGSFPHYFYTSATSFFYGKEAFRTGVATSSPVQPSSTNFVRTQVLEPVANSPKITLITRYPLRFSTKQLTVVNIHGINFVDATSYRKEINRIYESIKNIPSPLIFAGDFNTWSDERDAVLEDFIKKLKLNEAAFSPDYRLKFNGHPLDHFFHTNDLKIISAKVEDFYRGSDHKPLELEVEYRPRTIFKRFH